MSVDEAIVAPILAQAVHFGRWKWTGDFATIDLIAATTNALNGGLDPSPPRQGRFPILRLYNPLQPFFDKTWRPSEIDPT